MRGFGEDTMGKKEKALEGNVSDGPALYKRCRETYKAMARESESDGEYLTYEGFITRLITDDLGYSNAYYSHIRNTLIKMGCVEQLVRGGATTPSVWRLFKEPTMELYEKAGLIVATPREQRLKDINTRLITLEEAYDDLEERIKKLEK